MGAGGSDDWLAELEAAAVAAKLRVDLLWDRAGPWCDAKRAVDDLAASIGRVLGELQRLGKEETTGPTT
jgi:hypothetical protein